jgi:hypothetical protein
LFDGGAVVVEFHITVERERVHEVVEVMDERDAGPEAIDKELGIAQPVVVGRAVRAPARWREPLAFPEWFVFVKVAVHHSLLDPDRWLCPTMKPLHFARTGYQRVRCAANQQE